MRLWSRRWVLGDRSKDRLWRGPIDYVSLLDATWQGEPDWGDDVWVAMDASRLVVEGPPYPGVLVRVGVPENGSVRVALCQAVPEWVSEQVADSELVVGTHGLFLEAGDDFAEIPVEAGTYPLQVWVQPVSPGGATAVAFVMGPRKPTKPGKPRA
jgi:hypothetical protein